MKVSSLLKLLLAFIATVWRLLLSVVRPVLGWILIVVGISIAISPVPLGFLLVIAGTALVGPRDWRLRWLRVHWRRLVRRMAASEHRLVSVIGTRIRNFERGLQRKLRDGRQWLDERFKRREPAEPALRPVTEEGKRPAPPPEMGVVAFAPVRPVNGTGQCETDRTRNGLRATHCTSLDAPPAAPRHADEVALVAERDEL